MLSAIRDFFEQRLAAPQAPAGREHTLELATATLLAEVVRLGQRYTQEERQRIVELLWRVAYADAALSAHEHHVIRKIADLLYVSHSAYIGAKMRAKEALEEGRGEGR